MFFPAVGDVVTPNPALWDKGYSSCGSDVMTWRSGSQMWELFGHSSHVRSLEDNAFATTLLRQSSFQGKSSTGTTSSAQPPCHR